MSSMEGMSPSCSTLGRSCGGRSCGGPGAFSSNGFSSLKKMLYSDLLKAASAMYIENIGAVDKVFKTAPPFESGRCGEPSSVGLAGPTTWPCLCS